MWEIFFKKVCSPLSVQVKLLNDFIKKTYFVYLYLFNYTYNYTNIIKGEYRVFYMKNQ